MFTEIFVNLRLKKGLSAVNTIKYVNLRWNIYHNIPDDNRLKNYADLR